MKLLVCISKVPDTTTKIVFTADNKELVTDKVQWIVNPYDEWYALVRALELKESTGGTVTVINVGPAENEQVIRKALAIGADDAIRIDKAPVDALDTARQIAAVANGKGYDMILCGKETINYNGATTPGMIAEIMDWPYISLATSMTLSGNTATLEREIEGGKETCEVNTPFVVGCQKGMAEARIPNMRGIMSARTKPIEVVTPVESSNATEVIGYTHPPEKSGCQYIDADAAGDLIELLHNDAKVI